MAQYRLIPLALFVLTAAGLIGCSRKTPDPVPTRPQEVIVDRPIVRVVTDYEDFTGRTEPIRFVELKARATGYLETILFKDGQDITEGKPLFELDRRQYQAEYDKAVAALAKAQRHADTMVANFERVEQLFKSGNAGKETLDVAAGERDEAKADIKFAKAALELAETNLRFTRVYAPFDGRLSRRMVDPGQLIKADETPLTTIVSLDELYATFDVDERTVSRFRDLIKKGEMKSSREEPRVVRIATASDEDNFPLSGIITFTDNQFDAGTGTLRVRAVIRNPKLNRPPWYMLSPGQFIRVRVPIGNPRPAVLVPESAIGSDQGQKYVFVVNDKNEVERRNVRLGQQFGVYRVVEDNVLTPEDRIIVEGLLRVRRGSKVIPKPAEAAKYPAVELTTPELVPAMPREK